MALMLNGKPVEIGTLLEYLPEIEDDPASLLPDHVTVTHIGPTLIEYEGIGVEGEIKISELNNRFAHYEPREKPPEYIIGHITDLLQIPPERLNIALDELKTVLPMLRVTLIAAKEARDQGTAVPKLTEEQEQSLVRLMFPVIRWIDDSNSDFRLRDKNKNDLMKVKFPR